MSVETIPERGVRLLRAEYSRQVKQLALESAQIAAIVQADIKRHAADDRAFAEMCRRTFKLYEARRG